MDTKRKEVRKKKVDEQPKAPNTTLTNVEEKVAWMIRNYGTRAFGEEYRSLVVAKGIMKFLAEMAEVDAFIKRQGFTFVDVVPK